jgi:hypothetical protein
MLIRMGSMDKINPFHERKKIGILLLMLQEGFLERNNDDRKNSYVV